MGRGGKQKQWGKDHGAGVHDYQLWRGSWSPRLRAETQGHPWREQSHKDHGAAAIFPAYDAMPQPSRVSKPGNPEQPIQHGRLHGLQELLNAARKAEIKLQKLIRAKDRAADQWEAFQKGLKESFIKEQSRFHKNGMRLDRDIAEATSEQDRAYEAIQQSVLRGGEAPDSSMSNDDAEACWDRMRSGWEQDEGESMDQVLRRAVQAPRNPSYSGIRSYAQADPGHAAASLVIRCYPAMGSWRSCKWCKCHASCPGLGGLQGCSEQGARCPNRGSCRTTFDIYYSCRTGTGSGLPQPRAGGHADLTGSSGTKGHVSGTSTYRSRTAQVRYQSCNHGPYGPWGPSLTAGGQARGQTGYCKIAGYEAFSWWNCPRRGGCPRGPCSSHRGFFGPGDARSRYEEWTPVPGTGSYGISWRTHGCQGCGGLIGPPCGHDTLRSRWRMWLSPWTSLVLLPPEEAPSPGLSPDLHGVFFSEIGPDVLVDSFFVQCQELFEQELSSFSEAYSAVCSLYLPSFSPALDRAHWARASHLGDGSSSSALRPAHLLDVVGTWAPPWPCLWPSSFLPPVGFRQRLTTAAWLHVAGALFFCWLFAGAQNTCIGCSGTRALHASPLSPSLWLDYALISQPALLLAFSFGRDLAVLFFNWVDAVGASPRIVFPELRVCSVCRHPEGLRGKSVALGSPPWCMTAIFCAWMASLLAVGARSGVHTQAGGSVHSLIEQQAGSMCVMTLLALQLGLLALLGHRFRVCTRGGRRCNLGLRDGLLVDGACSLGRISSAHTGPLHWYALPVKRSRPDRETLCPSPRHGQIPRRGRGALLQILVFVVGFTSLPMPCQAHYTWAFAAPLLVPVSLVDGANHQPGSMAVDREPHAIPVEELVDHVGDPVLPRSPAEWAFQGEDRDSMWVADAACQRPFGRSGLQGRWLGVIVLTPHYRSQYVAIRCRSFHGPQHVADVIVDSVPGGPPEVGVICVPVRPQRSVEYATFVRFPTSIRHHPQGRRAAVILDLTLVGGNCFPCLLPQQFTVRELVAFVAPMIPDSELPLRLYVAESVQPYNRDPLVLQDGFVLSFDRAPSYRLHAPTIAELFDHPSRWCAPERMPRAATQDGVLVHHGQDRFYMPSHHHTGQTVLDAVRVVYDHDAAASVSCAFKTPDLDFRGNAVSHILFVAGVTPRPANVTAAETRRDHFALCDFRPVGYNPRIVHTSVHSSMFRHWQQCTESVCLRGCVWVL